MDVTLKITLQIINLFHVIILKFTESVFHLSGRDTRNLEQGEVCESVETVVLMTLVGRVLPDAKGLETVVVGHSCRSTYTERDL